MLFKFKSKCLSSIHLLRDRLENSLRHLHGNYKQDVEGKCDPNFLVRWKFPRKSIMSVMSKNIETSIINCFFIFDSS